MRTPCAVGFAHRGLSCDTPRIGRRFRGPKMDGLPQGMTRGETGALSVPSGGVPGQRLQSLRSIRRCPAGNGRGLHHTSAPPPSRPSFERQPDTHTRARRARRASDRAGPQFQWTYMWWGLHVLTSILGRRSSASAPLPRTILARTARLSRSAPGAAKYGWDGTTGRQHFRLRPRFGASSRKFDRVSQRTLSSIS